jgi:hypothetical protein
MFQTMSPAIRANTPIPITIATVWFMLTLKEMFDEPDGSKKL